MTDHDANLDSQGDSSSDESDVPDITPSEDEDDSGSEENPVVPPRSGSNINEPSKGPDPEEPETISRNHITGTFSWESSKYSEQVRNLCSTGSKLSMLAVVYPFLKSNVEFVYKLLKSYGPWLRNLPEFLYTVWNTNYARNWRWITRPLSSMAKESFKYFRTTTIVEDVIELKELPSAWRNAVVERVEDTLQPVTSFVKNRGMSSPGLLSLMYTNWTIYRDEVLWKSIKYAYSGKSLKIMAFGICAATLLYQMSKLLSVRWVIDIGNKIDVPTADHRPMPMAQLDIKYHDPNIRQYTRRRWLSLADQTWIPWFQEHGHISEEVLSHALATNIMSVAGDYEVFRQKLDRCIETMHRVNVPRGHMLDWGNVGRHTGFVATGLWLRDRQTSSDMDF